jgi:hypothetical protein
MRNPNAGPAAYLHLRGEGDRRAQTGPPWSASAIAQPVLCWDTNARSSRIRAVQLAGIPIREEDVYQLAGLLRTDGFLDVADELTKALRLETKVLALSIADRESILRTLDDPPTTALAELRGVLLQEHEWRVRQGLV